MSDLERNLRIISSVKYNSNDAGELVIDMNNGNPFNIDFDGRKFSGIVLDKKFESNDFNTLISDMAGHVLTNSPIRNAQIVHSRKQANYDFTDMQSCMNSMSLDIARSVFKLLKPMPIISMSLDDDMFTCKGKVFNCFFLVDEETDELIEQLKQPENMLSFSEDRMVVSNMVRGGRIHTRFKNSGVGKILDLLHVRGEHNDHNIFDFEVTKYTDRFVRWV